MLRRMCTHGFSTSAGIELHFLNTTKHVYLHLRQEECLFTSEARGMFIYSWGKRNVYLQMPHIAELGILLHVGQSGTLTVHRIFTDQGTQ